MPFNGSGTFSLTYSWATEAGSPPIAISKLDTQEQDIADALSNCVLRDGTGKPTADLDWNAKKITNIANSTTRTGVPATGQIQDASLVVVGSVSGTDTITGSLTPAITAYGSNMFVIFEPAANNTGAATINLNSVGAKSIVKWDGDALVADDLVDGVPAFLLYDGTSFYLLNPQTVNLTAAQILTLIKTVDGSGSGLDADTLDGSSSAAFAAASHTHANGDLTGYTAADVLSKLLTVDGSGSGLDADLLDGSSSAAFVKGAGTETISGAWTFSGTRPVFNGGFLSHNNTSNTGGGVTITSTTPTDTTGMNPGDIKLVY